jgi:hypothetical protein
MENGMNHHTRATGKGCLMFPNLSLIRLECPWKVRLVPGFGFHHPSQCIGSGFHHLPSATHLTVQWTNRSQSVTWLTTPICDMWSVRVVTRTHYPNKRSLTAPRAMSLEISHSQWPTPHLSKISQIDHQVHISRLGWVLNQDYGRYTSYNPHSF